LLSLLAIWAAFWVVSCGVQQQAAGLTSPPAPELWYWHHSYLASDDAVDKSRALIDRAVAAGYTGLVLWDSGLNYLGDVFWPPENENEMRDIFKYASRKHLKLIAAPAAYGYSNEQLEANPNLAESQRIIGAQFQVDTSGKRLNFENSFPGLENPGFESGKTAWFGTGDAGLGINSVAHSGKQSAVIVDAPGNARLRQNLRLQPWRQYHVRLWFRSSNFRGAPMVSVFDGGNLDKVRVNANISANGSHDWTRLDYMFNSQESTEGVMYFGVWGGSSGVLWFDDISVEETALVYLTRRPGTPIKVYDPVHPDVIFEERRDFNAIEDERMVEPGKAFTDEYHDAPGVTLPRKTRLKPGQTVAIDFYSVFPVPGLHSVSMCMTEPEALKIFKTNGRAIHRILPADAGLFLGYDEIRQMNSCASCRAKHMTAGQLLAWSVGQSIQTYNAVAPGNALYIWSDMFDPYHNARDHYFYVEGDLVGSWKGISQNVTVMNWNLDHLHNSLTWFSGLDAKQPIPHQQLIAGYYDSGNGSAAAQKELQAAAGIPGLRGLMYTTWSDDYGQLEPFASTVKANWDQYLSTLR
jgi:hypothetical protein